MEWKRVTRGLTKWIGRGLLALNKLNSLNTRSTLKKDKLACINHDGTTARKSIIVSIFNAYLMNWLTYPCCGR